MRMTGERLYFLWPLSHMLIDDVKKEEQATLGVRAKVFTE